jgi:signal transduction histidine kinase
MSQSRPADALLPGVWYGQRGATPPRAPRNRRVPWQLIVLIAIPAVLALTLTGLWATDDARSAGAYGQVGQLAALGQQVTGLAQAMANERSGTAVFIAGGRPAAGLPALRRQYAITDARAARVRQLVSQLGSGYPAQTRAGTAQVLASIAKLPGLRRQAVQSQASALAVITGYAAAASGLFPVIDGIADLSGNPTLVTSVRALGSLSRMTDQASRQQAILSAALAEGRFEPGALTALTTAQAQQAGDLASFRGSANPEESWAVTVTLAGTPARQAQAVEQQAIAASNGVLALGPQASQQWSAGMSYTVGWLGHAGQELAAWITADAQAQQRSATRSAIVTGAAGLGALAVVLLGAMFAARSLARRRGRLNAAAPEATAAPLPGSDNAAPLASSAQASLPGSAVPALPSSDSTVPAGFVWRSHSLLERLLRLIDSAELNEDDPERLAHLFEMDHVATRLWRNSDSALALTGHETPHQAEPLALVDVLRAATSEIEQYGRVTLDVQGCVRVSGSAATDTVHLLAELLENATRFSPETTEVVVSGHAVCGGGSLVTITDGGPGMSEEELALLNWQLVNPSLADMAGAPQMGLSAVALLAARHGITVTLSVPPDGGTAAEVYLPAALVSLDAGPGRWQSRAGEAPLAGASEEAAAQDADLPTSARRPASEPEPLPGPETGMPEAVPAMLSAPVPAPAPGTSTGATEPEPVGAEPDDEPPIFESVRSGYLHAFGRDLGQPSDPQDGQPRPAPQPSHVPSAAVDQETRQATAAESAEITQSRLAGFQQGSRRGRMAAQMNRGATQPGQNGAEES